MEAVAPPHMPAAGPLPLEITQPETQPLYIIEVEANCDECGGSGFDPGGIDPWGPEPCPACHGAGTQRITKNYLAEALRIAGNPECSLPVERALPPVFTRFPRTDFSWASIARKNACSLGVLLVFGPPRHRRLPALFTKLPFSEVFLPCLPTAGALLPEVFKRFWRKRSLFIRHYLKSILGPH